MTTATDSSARYPENRVHFRSRFGLILALSALTHSFIIIFSPRPFLSSESVERPEPIIVRIEIAQPQPTPEPEPAVQARPQSEPQQQAHLPRHNAEQTDLRGTDFESPVDEQVQAGKKPAPQPKVQAEDDSRTNLAEGEQTEAAERAVEPEVTTESARRSIAEKQAEKPKNPTGMEDLSDEELAGANAGSPVSELEKRRIQMVNQFLARMQDQVDRRFRKPLNARAYQEGEIAFELDPSGYLLSARIIESSGNTLLDASALEAIRSVPRFDVPESALVAARYYRHLTFRYTGE